MLNALLQNELKALLAEEDDAGLREFVHTLHPVSVAEAMEEMPADDVWTLLSKAPLAQQAEIFRHLPIEQQIDIGEGSGRERMSRLIEAMPSDDRADLLGLLDPKVTESLLPLVAQAERQDILMLLARRDGSAGALMSTEYATVPGDVTADEAIQILRRQAPNRETIYYVYVLDGERRLQGIVTVRQLLTSKGSARVGEIMRRDPVKVNVNADQEEVVTTLARYNFIAVPIVDDDDRLVGIVTHDDALDVLQEEQTEDAHRMGAVEPVEDDYLEASFVEIWRKRAIWLSCLFLAELFTFTALASYEDLLKHVFVLSLFVPLVMSTGGNSGSQAATLICRAMALGQVRTRDWWRVLKHELAMGVALGLTLGVLGGLRAWATPSSTYQTPPTAERAADGSAPERNPDPGAAKPAVPVTAGDLAVIIGLSVACVCLWGSLIGSLLPMLFRRLGLDPGYASSPFVATFVDVTGIIIYANIALMVLPGI